MLYSWFHPLIIYLHSHTSTKLLVFLCANISFLLPALFVTIAYVTIIKRTDNEEAFVTGFGGGKIKIYVQQKPLDTKR